MSKQNLIISLNGQEGSGKSTIATMLSEKLNIPRYYMGQIYRDMAKERGLTLPEFRKICDADPSFDNQLDAYVISLPKNNKSFVIESRTAWHFIPQSIKIYLKVNPKTAAERIFNGLAKKNNRANEDINLNTIESIEKSILKRRKEDNDRYFSLYKIQQDDEKNYDFILDTTGLTINAVLEEILSFINEKSN